MKQHWERRQAYLPLTKSEAQQVVMPVTTDMITSLTLLKNGCINTHYRVDFEHKRSLVLRFYQRDAQAAAREQALHTWLQGKLPVPECLYRGNYQGHCYSIMKWAEGQVMRDVLLTADATTQRHCTALAGQVLATMHSLTFEQQGFFNDDLSVTPMPAEYDSMTFAHRCIEQLNVPQWHAVFERHHRFFDDSNIGTLTHADFDPSNLLIEQVNGQWRITAILDWEFAFAGHLLFDIGVFLRFAHTLPSCYQKGFIEGFTQQGSQLPEDWPLACKLYDALFLLDLLCTNSKTQRPTMIKEATALLAHYYQILS